MRWCVASCACERGTLRVSRCSPTTVCTLVHAQRNTLTQKLAARETQIHQLMTNQTRTLQYIVRACPCHAPRPNTRCSVQPCGSPWVTRHTFNSHTYGEVATLVLGRPLWV